MLSTSPSLSLCSLVHFLSLNLLALSHLSFLHFLCLSLLTFSLILLAWLLSSGLVTQQRHQGRVVGTTNLASEPRYGVIRKRQNGELY